MAKKIMFNDKFGLTQAVLSGRKTMTRRIAYEFGYRVDKCKIWGNNITYMDGKMQVLGEFPNPRYKVGEVVAIAQRYCELSWDKKIYDKLRSMCKGLPQYELAGWNNKLFVRADLMPHHIRITDVRAERMQDISDEDCIKEGIRKYYIGFESDENDYTGFTYSFDETGKYKYPNARAAFASLIDKVSGNGTWDSNPYVFVYEFELVD